jgi:hypothetical protein
MTGDLAVSFITKVIELTQKKQLVWESDSPAAFSSLIPGEQIKVRSVFTSRLQNRKLRIYSYYRLESYYPNNVFTNSDVSTFYGGKLEKRWEEVRVLEILDSNNNLLSEYRGRSVVWDLLDVVRLQVGQIDDFINKVIKG